MSQNPGAKLMNNGFDFTPTIHTDTYDFIRPAQFDLANRVVFITGASRGIGRSIAISYASAGASYIALAARSDMTSVKTEVESAASQAGRKPPQVVLLTVDVTNEQSVQAAAEQVEKSFGRLDILVNNAGAAEPFVPILEGETELWWRTWEINVKGTYLVTKTFMPLMFKSTDGLSTILNLSSVGGQLCTPGGSGYKSGKLALLRFGEFIDSEYSDRGILSYGIHPGGVQTDLAQNMPEDVSRYLVDTLELAADSIVWLTAERREWLAGRYISCNWDMKEFLGKRAKIEAENLLKVRMDVGMD